MARLRSLLAVWLDNSGDMVMLNPALRAITESLTDRRLMLLASSAGAAVALMSPRVDESPRGGASGGRLGEQRSTRTMTGASSGAARGAASMGR